MHEFQNLHATNKARIQEFVRGHFYGWVEFMVHLMQRQPSVLPLGIKLYFSQYWKKSVMHYLRQSTKKMNYLLESCSLWTWLWFLFFGQSSGLQPGKDPLLLHCWTLWVFKQRGRYFPGVTVPTQLPTACKCLLCYLFTSRLMCEQMYLGCNSTHSKRSQKKFFKPVQITSVWIHLWQHVIVVVQLPA